LSAIAHHLIGHLRIAKFRLWRSAQVETKKDSASAQELLAKQVGTYDEAELCKLLLEISLLNSAYQRSSASFLWPGGLESLEKQMAANRTFCNEHSIALSWRVILRIARG
jgi:hypothetical protein